MTLPSRTDINILLDKIHKIIELEEQKGQDYQNVIENYLSNKITKKDTINKLKEDKFKNIRDIDCEILENFIQYSDKFSEIAKKLEIKTKRYTLKKRVIFKDIEKVTVKFLNLFKKKNVKPLNAIIEKTETKNIKFEVPKDLKPENYQILIDGFAYAFIENKNNYRRYVVAEPELSEEELKVYEELKVELINKISLIDLKDKNSLFDNINKIFDKKKIVLDNKQKANIVYYIAKQIKGLDKIEPLMHDNLIEDIECNGIGIPIFIVHRKYGHIATNLAFETEKELQDFVVKMAHLCKSYVSYANPLLDSILPDGSRVNAVLTSNVSTRGPTFTIRKFPQKPFTAIDLIKNKTIDSMIMAYIWTAIEFKKTIIIIGPTAAGKTTLLNIISSFIPSAQRIVSIEDTREINLLMENWTPQITRPGFGPPDATGKKYGEVTMVDLLKGSFRQRPDYLIVGEVRGEEMSIMFQGMASGHCCLSTIHSKSLKDLVNRLITPPISLDPSLLTSLNITIVTGFKAGNEITRYIREINEIKDYNFTTKKIEYNTIYSIIKEYEEENEENTEKSDLFTKDLPITYKSEILKDISVENNIPLKELLEIINKRKKFLDELTVTSPKDFVEFKLALNKFKDAERISNVS